MFKNKFKKGGFGRMSFGSYKGRNASRMGFRGSKKSQVQITDFNKYINKAEPVAQEVYQSQHSFTDFQLEQRLLDNIRAKGYTEPMPIQDQSIPHILAGRDLLGLANTGMGKTAAFLIPLLNKMLKDPAQKVLIITPTRELAEQIIDECDLLSRGMGINSVLVIGGASINRQSWLLRKHWNIVVGTPGRLKDLLQRKALILNGVNNLVLDEVDRMFDMGFSKDVSLLLSSLAPVRQSLFFSATLGKREEALVRANSKDAVKVTVKTRETAASVDQDVVRINPGMDKLETLHDILIKEEVKKTLVFARTKYGVEKLSVALIKRGFKAGSIHGNKSQYQRQQVLKKFKEDAINILVATDVAARGLDIPKVSHVINYEAPENYEDYVHRIGRTGRANQQGKALTFI